ncbi:MAG: insulinase family protein [Spirochaetia bacterium]|nr:insulinase family protein [Spirochaetia bacterium]
MKKARLPIKQAGSFDLAPFFEGVERRVLANGLTVLVYSDRRFPIISFQLWVKTGSIMESPWLGSGISHYLEHALFLGTKERPKVGQFSREAEILGGADNNAHTSYEHTAFYFTLTSSALHEGLSLLHDLVSHPLFPKDRLSRERDVILAEMDMDTDDPESLMSRDFLEKIFPSHPYRIPIIGHRDAFKDLTRDDLVAYHQSRYVPGNMVLTVAGDLDADQAFAEIDMRFVKMKQKLPPYLQLADESQRPSIPHSTLALDIEKPRLRFAYPAVSLSHPDATALDLLETILSWGRDSHFYRNYLSVGKVLSLEANSWTPTSRGIFEIQATLHEGGEPEGMKILRVLKDDLANFHKVLEEKHLAEAKYKCLAEAVSGLETTSGMANSLAGSEIFSGNCYAEMESLERIGRVSLDELKAVAKKYFTESAASVLYLPRTHGRAARSMAAKPKKSAEHTAHKSGDESQTLHSSKPAKKIETFGPESFRRVKTENGATLLLQDKPRSLMNYLSIIFRGGQEYETADKLGVFNLFVKMILEGVRGLSREELMRRIEARGGSLQSFSGSNAFALSLAYFPDEEKSVLETFFRILKEPVFPSDSLRIHKEKIVESLQMVSENISEEAHELLKKTLFGAHPYASSTRGTEASVAKLGRTDLQKVLEDFVTADNLVVSLSGRVNEALLLKHLAGLRPSKWKAEAIPFKPLDLKGEKISKHLEKDQKIYQLAFYAPSVGHADTLEMEFLSAFLNGQGGPLFELREKSGLAYQVGAFYEPRRDTGLFALTITLGEQAKNKDGWVNGEFWKIIRRLKKGAVTDEELRRAHHSLRGSKALVQQSRMEECFQTAFYERMGFGYENWFKDNTLPEKPDLGKLRASLARIAEIWLNERQSVFLKVGSSS